MSAAELAEYREDELSEDFEIAKQLRVTMSFRLSAAEADAIRETAAIAGTSAATRRTSGQGGPAGRLRD